jgi:hypothetical protein
LQRSAVRFDVAWHLAAACALWMLFMGLVSGFALARPPAVHVADNRLPALIDGYTFNTDGLLGVEVIGFRF